MNFKEKMVLFLATGFYVGNIPKAPGTVGTIEGLLFCFFLSKMALFYVIIFVAFFILFSIWISDRAERILQEKDSGSIVIDEIAGIMVTLIGMPFNFITVISGFFVFRLLDIIKPFPICSVEKRLSGGFGIVMDDVVAGIIGNCILRVIFYSTGLI
ncbi:MAG: phosphatidylglycerophosphatase A [Proteobacteria bacterium]|nr:phosphatidylglycerophosphatase A [Pseudomonadota bacterium]